MLPTTPRLSAFVFALALSCGICAEAGAVDLTGTWSGRWESCVTGHNGPLHANFCRVDATRYRVRFHGRFFKVLPFIYSVDLRVVSEGQDYVTLEGESYLGRRLGTFTYRAEADNCHFESTYDACRDNGRFILDRR